MNKKNLLRICVYVVGLLVIVISELFLYQMIPNQTFTTMGMVRLVINLLILLIVFGAINLTLRKYGVQITSTAPKTRIISEVIIVALFIIGLGYIFVLFMNK